MIYINAVGMLNALGNTIDEISQNLSHAVSPGMLLCENWLQSGEACMLGVVKADLPAIPEYLKNHTSRNNQLLLAALEPIQAQLNSMIEQYGTERVAVIMGTSTSGLDESDKFVSASLSGSSGEDYHYFQQELGDPSRFLANYLGLTGPAYTISTACSSSARAILAGQRLIHAGIVDAALVGGADTLSRMSINGFKSLDALSQIVCQPFAKHRMGITIGEGSCLLLLSREPADVALIGGGESSDAFHMSAPNPAGVGAERAIRMALSSAKLETRDIGYINLHGTGTLLNDEMESKVINRIFAENTPCSSTKHLTGHMLGAAGAGEVGLCWLILHHQLALPAQNFIASPKDDTLPECGLLTSAAPLEKSVILSNSFAFGGNNCALILKGIKHDIC